MINPIQFLKEAKSELLKVVWPSKRETFRVTIAVILLSLAMAVFLGVIDYGLTKLFEFTVERQ